jgi:hypothetical protein
MGGASGSALDFSGKSPDIQHITLEFSFFRLRDVTPILFVD